MQLSAGFSSHWPPFQNLLLHSPFSPLVTIALCINSAVLLITVYWQRTSTAWVIFTATVAVLAGAIVQLENTSNALIMTSAILLSIAILRDSYKMAYRDELTG